MSALETFTAEEITSILNELGVTVEYDAESDEYEMDCEFGEISFYGFLLTQEPFFEEITLKAGTWISENPYEFVNSYNSSKRVSTAFVVVDENGLLERNDDGQVFVIASFTASFVGGITRNHLEFLMSIWIEDLFDLNQIQSEDDEDDLDSIDSLKIPDDLSVAAGTLEERITALLEIGGAKSAREISRALKVDKQTVNRTLYKNRSVFIKSADQPPIWTVHEADA
jgi:hypothetical protein